MSDCNCTKNNELTQLQTRIAVMESKLIDIEGDLESMNNTINRKIDNVNERLEKSIEKIANQYDRLIIFGFSTSIGMIITLLTTVITTFIK